MQRPPEEERFKSNAIVMTQALQNGLQKLHQDGYPVDLTVVTLAAAIINGFKSHDLINGFIKKSHLECWDKIKNRDEDYFVNNVSTIFEQLPMQSVNLFKDLFLTKDSHGVSVVSESLKTQIWCLFDAMIKISIQYIHKHREMVDGKYTKSFFDDVDVEHHAKVWQCRL